MYYPHLLRHKHAFWISGLLLAGAAFAIYLMLVPAAAQCVPGDITCMNLP